MASFKLRLQEPPLFKHNKLLPLLPKTSQLVAIKSEWARRAQSVSEVGLQGDNRAARTPESASGWGKKPCGIETNWPRRRDWNKAKEEGCLNDTRGNEEYDWEFWWRIENIFQNGTDLRPSNCPFCKDDIAHEKMGFLQEQNSLTTWI